MRFPTSFILAFACASHLALGAALQHGESQESWPALCQNGTEQSPINIDLSTAVNPGNKMRRLRLNYGTVSNYTLLNDGHTLKVLLSPEDKPRNTLRGGLTAKGSSYKLYEMHMHWGSPENGDKGSEHLLDNEQFTMEMHLVHYKGSYPDETAALESGDRDALAVMTTIFVLDDKAPANPALDAFLKHVKQVKYSGQTLNGVQDPIDFTALVPSAYLAKARAGRAATKTKEEHILNNFRDPQALNGRPVYHFTQDGQDLIGYMGSLTTPDYNEQVVWSVANPSTESLAITSSQLYKLYSLIATPAPTVQNTPILRNS